MLVHSPAFLALTRPQRIETMEKEMSGKEEL